MTPKFNFMMFYLFILTLIIFITLVLINTIRLSYIKKDINSLNEQNHIIKHSHVDLVEMENLDINIKKHYRKIFIKKLIPLLVDYFNKYFEINNINSFLNDNEEKIHEVLDTLIERGYTNLEKMEKDEDIEKMLEENLEYFIKILDLEQS
tara:strand:- start:577 stop:1026 length:450 start_codon:yes stop_codon:yes gene_type:complete